MNNMQYFNMLGYFYPFDIHASSLYPHSLATR